MILKVKVTGTKQVQNKLRQVARKTGNPTAANKRVSTWLLRWVNKNFRTEGGFVGGWAPFKRGGRVLPDGTVDTTAKLLQDTGRLRASFRPFYGRKFAGIGSNLRYSVTHELGLPHKNLPARRMLPRDTDRALMQQIIRIYDNYIKRTLR